MTQDEHTPPPATLRADRIRAVLRDVQDFRFRQIEVALFDPSIRAWADVTTLSHAMREALAAVPWMSVTQAAILKSRAGDTFKAALATEDGLVFESVLMANRRGQWTICVSSQVGCAMGCTFCATGAMGLTRSLTADEIADQYRFWMYWLQDHAETVKYARISNIVFMGMGEPLANYANVKSAITTWLRVTDIGTTRITVSTVGVLPQLERILTDPAWPHVRIAISLHSANEERRREIVPTTAPKFLERLADWAQRYHQSLGNRRHHVTYEYTLLNEVNDTPEHARELARFIARTGSSKVNVIPWNPVAGKPFVRAQQERIDTFKRVLLDAGYTVTQRKTMGDDIAAACGQLATVKRSAS
ncbi:MAG: 23S rRNA (adenine(2503)-C(2))-methyltransferase RlmN [bacterium]|nr:23S rRNA (adenine(2503)-C(2))-methyltransferase RlmN [bacterium]